MAKNKLTDYSATAADNEDVGGVGILGTNKISNFDNAVRELMSHLAETNAGTYPVADTWTFADPSDLTKGVRLDAGNVTAGQTRVLTAPDRDLSLTVAAEGIKFGSSVNMSGKSDAEFTNIPSGTRRIVMVIGGLSTNGTTVPQVQIGDSGGYEGSGYLGSVANLPNGSSVNAASIGSGFPIGSAWAAAATISGHIELIRYDSALHVWSCSGVLGRQDTTSVHLIGGVKTLSAELDRVRLTLGSDAGDAGAINVSYFER